MNAKPSGPTTNHLAARATAALALLFLARGSFAEPAIEFIWEKAPFPSAHASTIAEAPGGALVAAWFGGTDEGNEDVGIWAARKEGGAWTAPVELFKEPKQPAWNPVLFVDSAKTLWLWFKFGPSPTNWTGAYIQSRDGGKTWGEVVYLPAGLLGPIKNKPIILADGAILSPTSVESYRSWASWMERSDDGGKTWQTYGPIVFPDAASNRKGTIQPTLLETKPGVVRAFFRTRGMGKIATALSPDGGKSWTPIKLTELDNPGAGVDAVRMADGRCALVYNPSKNQRNPLTVAVSKDGGETWKDFVELDRLPPGEPGDAELSYPSIIQSSSGSLHVVYTFKRERIKHAEIPLADVPN